MLRDDFCVKHGIFKSFISQRIINIFKFYLHIHVPSLVPDMIVNIKLNINR